MVLGLVTCVPAPPALCYSEFDRILKCRWKEAAETGLCRYRLDRLQNKILLGKYGFVAQYNPEKSKPGWRRPCQNLRQVNTAFDPLQFSFNQINPREVLMVSQELTESEEIDTFLVINASPLEFGSSLLVPRLTQNIPQRITIEGLETLLKTVLRSADRHLKAGFSSPGGCASVNHQHYHLYYLQEQLYLENAPAEHIAGPCYALTAYPSKGFAFQLDKDPTELARHVFTLADYMRQNEMAHNMFITRGKRFKNSKRSSAVEDIHYDTYDTLRVYLWAREPAWGVKKDYGMNPALCELAGHLLTTDALEYKNLTEDSVCTLLETLTAPWYQRVLPKIQQLFRDDFQDST